MSLTGSASSLCCMLAFVTWFFYRCVIYLFGFFFLVEDIIKFYSEIICSYLMII